MQDRTAEDDLAFAATGPLSALASATYCVSRVNWTTQSGFRYLGLQEVRALGGAHESLWPRPLG